jgi:hypothetical protein
MLVVGLPSDGLNRPDFAGDPDGWNQWRPRHCAAPTEGLSPSIQADAVGSYPLSERCGIEILALWQVSVPARMALALKQTLYLSVKLSGSNSAGRVSASQARPWAHLSPSPVPPPSAHRSAGPLQFSAPGYIKRWAIVGQIHDLPIRLVPRRGWCSCWPHGRPVGPAARPDRRFATGHCRPTSTRTLSSARTDVGWSVTTTWARG